MKKWMTIGALAFAVVAADAGMARAQDFVDENGDGVDDGAALVHKHGRRGFLRGVRGQLTEAQRAEVKAAIEALKASDASKDEVRAAIGEMLAGYGVELPDRNARMVERLGSVLTEEQLAEVQATIGELVSSDASRSDVRAAVDGLLEGYGVDISSIRPERGQKPGKFRGRRGGFRGPAPADTGADAN